MLAHPHGALTTAYALTLIGGPAIYLIGGAIYKKVVYGAIPTSHALGVLALIPVAYATDLLVMGGLTMLALLAVGLWEARALLNRRNA